MMKNSAAKGQMGKFFKLVFPAAAILLVGLFAICTVFVYKLSHPGAVPESATPSHYLLPSLDLATPAENGDIINGWWIPGLKGAPGIILAPGYGMSRTDALSLAVGLHNYGFNLFVYDQRGSGESPRGASTLGLYETQDMRAAVRLLRDRPEVNRERIGIWGVDIGALAALKAAAEFPEIRAIAADSVFLSPGDFLSYRIEEEFGLNNRLLQFGCYQVFKLYHVRGSLFADDALPLRALADRNILFIKGDNRRILGNLTTEMYDAVLPQKEMISFKAARVHSMSGEDLKNYDRQVVNFFHLNLP
jgi:uncharacterized protein